MTQSEVSNLLLKIQENYDISRFTYKNKQVWPILRYYMAYGLLTSKQPTTNPTDFIPHIAVDPVKKNTTAQKLFSILSLPSLIVKNIRQKKLFLKVAKNVLFLSPSDLYPDKIENKKYSRYIDPYFEILNKKHKTIKVQLATNGQNFNNLYYNTHVIKKDSFLKSRQILESLQRLFVLEKCHNKFYVELDSINNYADKNNIPYYFNRWLVDMIDEANQYELFFYFLLKDSPVKIIFFEQYYSACIFGLIAASKRLSIKTVDIQHGIVDINYLAWNNFQSKENSYLPDYYWVWSKMDYIQMEKQNFNYALKPVLGGNLWLGKFIKNKNDLLKNSEKFKKFDKKILVSLQYGTELIDYMSHLLPSLIGNCKENYLWMLRFHPLNNDKEKEAIMLAISNYKNVEFVWATQTNLYDVFQVTDAHVVASSAVALEGLQFGVPTIIVHESGGDVFKELIQKNVFAYSNNAEEILNQIKKFQPSVTNEDYKISTSEEEAFSAFNYILNDKT